MLYEMCTYNLKPGAVAEFEKLFADAYPVRSRYSRLYGAWHTEIGPLNQVVQIWGYDNLQQAGRYPNGCRQGPQREVASR